ncbi:hypothetical protein QYE76_011704 [Lolium multiflorum]|uniref:Reverse transcriptase Ty1/copia-type domain-containing protein n=1 Tax=Lolium multiflorum TaxID=4521 RepID=A0AAD8TZK8_LOLMU|nr:hypothetical protein QYE76_011704 [Lolium multiflorum]
MMGELKFFLGFQVSQLAKGTFISQEKYVKDILKKFDMAKASPMKTPMPVKGQLGSCDGEKDVDIKQTLKDYGVSLLPAKTHRRAATGNTESREAPRLVGPGPSGDGPQCSGTRPGDCKGVPPDLYLVGKVLDCFN